MNRRFVIMSLGLAATMLICAMSSQSWGQGRGQGFRACPYSPYVCPVDHECKSFDDRGKVAQVLTETLGEGMYPGMALKVDTKAHGRIHVHLGPIWYLERQDFEVKPGDEVGIKGMTSTKKDKKELEIIAYELTVGEHVLLLRDSRGRPNWEAWRRR